MRNATMESNSGSNPGRTVQLVYVDENRKLKTDPEAITALQKLKGPIAIVSLFGKSLHGKSFIWNQLLSKSIGFEVQTLHRPCNGDIWMWIEPMKRISQDGTEYNLVLLDVEAAESNCILAGQIFALAILLSTVFIYGPALGVNNIAVNDLSRILDIGEATSNTLFVQLLAEINSESGEDATRNENLGKLQPKLLYGINALMKFVSKRVRPKRRGDTIVTGPPLAGFTKSFSENVNNNVVLNVSSLWQSVEEIEGRRARDTATEVYMSSLERLETTPVEESMLLEAHSKAVVKALNTFCESSIGNAEVKQKYKTELWSFFAKAFEDHKRVANIEAYSRCCNAIEDMSKKLWALPCSHDANIDDMIKALDNAVSDYEISINGPMKWQTLSSFLRKSMQDILVHRRRNQLEELVSENSKMKLQQREMESEKELLKKQIEGGEKIKKEYQKLYESAIDDMGKLSDQFKNRIHELESKCKSIHDEHSKVMEVLGSTKLEASEWKRKYEEMFDENGVKTKSNRVEASIIRCDKWIDWKIKCENVVNERKAGLEKIAEMEERFKQGLAKEDGMRVEFARVLDEKEKVITEKDAKLVTLEQQLASLRSEIKKGELKVEECRLKAKELRLEIESMKSAVGLLETETERLKQEKDELEKKCVLHLEELEKLRLNLKNAENEALAGKELAETARNKEKELETSLQEKCVEIEKTKSYIAKLEKLCLNLGNEESEGEASRKKLQTLLEEKCDEMERAKNRIEELEKICLKLKDVETEAVRAEELVSSMRTEMEIARSNEEKLQTSLQERIIEGERAKERIEELEREKMELSETLENRAKQSEEAVAELQRIINLEKEKEESLKVSDDETAMEQRRTSELVSSMETEREAARENENKLQTSLQEKIIEIERSKGVIEDLERQKMELSETLEKRTKQSEEAVSELQRIINAGKEKNTRVNVNSQMEKEEEDSVMVQQRVKRLRVETTRITTTTCSGSDFAKETEEEEDTVSQESRKAMTAMTPRKCTITEAGGASSPSTGLDYSQYTMKKLRSEILKNGFGAELVVLKNPRKRELLEVYERCVLRK